MATKMQQRRGTSAQWTAANPVLADGEIGFEKDTGIVKMGNGVSTWNQLSPILGSSYLPVLGKAYDSERLDGLDSSAFAKTNDLTDAVTGTSSTRKLGYHWGSGTDFPVAGVRAADTYFHTGLLSLMQFNGTAWRQAEVPSVANAGARTGISSNNTYKALLYPGFTVNQTDDGARYEWDGTIWLPYDTKRQAWTPQIAIGVVTSYMTLGNAVVDSGYWRRGRLVDLDSAVKFGSTTSWNGLAGVYYVKPPTGLAPRSNAAAAIYSNCGVAEIVGPGGGNPHGFVGISTDAANDAALRRMVFCSSMATQYLATGNAQPWVINAAGHILQFNCTYETAFEA